MTNRLNVSYWWFGLIIFSSVSVNALTFHETMKHAFLQNPLIESNNLQIESARARTRAAWKRLWPGISLTYSYSFQRYASDDGQNVITGSQGYHGGDFEVSMDLYNGHADLYAAKAADANLKALEAQLNSTNAYIPDTKGAIANLVASAYFSILAQHEAVELINEREVLLAKMLIAARSDEDRRAVQIQIDGLKVEKQNAEQDLASAERDYQFAVKEPAPEQLDSFDTVISEIHIPLKLEEALEKARAKSPALQAARYESEAAGLSRKSLEASLYSPKLSGYISRGVSKSWQPGLSSSRTHSTTYGLSLTIPIDFGAKDLSQSAQLDELRANRKVTAADSQLEYSLGSVYSQFDSQQRVLVTVQENFQKALFDIQQLKRALDEGTPIDIKFTLDRTFRNYDSTWGQLLNLRVKIVNTKFNIQRTIGTLFDEIDEVVLEQQRRRAKEQR